LKKNQNKINIKLWHSKK